MITLCRNISWPNLTGEKEYVDVKDNYHEFMSVEGLVAGGGGPDTSHRVVAGGGRLGGRRG